MLGFDVPPGIIQILSSTNDCSKTGLGDNLADCEIFSTDNILGDGTDAITQDNLVTVADDDVTISQDNGVTVAQAIFTENDCDESSTSPSNNAAFCHQEGDLDNIIRHIDQSNEAEALDFSVSDQDNNVDLLQNLFTSNDCDALDTGGNTAECTNNGSDDANFIDDITQGNEAQLSSDAFSEQFSNLAIDQSAGLVNDCDELEEGVNDVDCENVEIENFVGPITQTTFSDAGAEAISATNFQSNEAQIGQGMGVVNECDEDGAGANLALCTNEADNFISELSQTSNADDVADDFVQDNFIGVIGQGILASNNCDEVDDGDNGDGGVDQFCGNNVGNSIAESGLITQQNGAAGTDVTDISQSNHIPSIGQLLIAANDCGQTGPGANLANCGNNAFNTINPITQTNDASGSLFTDIFEDNDATISQSIDVGNNCDGITFGLNAEDNIANCNNAVTNFFGPVSQTNLATGEFDALIDQDNNADLSQNIIADNNCDGTGTHGADCTNENAFNNLAGVAQTNTADDELDASSTQVNNAVVDQDMGLLNDCDEGDLGNTIDTFCQNFEPANFIGPITQSNDNQAGAEADTATIDQINDVEVTQNLQSVNDCDESGDSDNQVECGNSPDNSIASIIQTNDADEINADVADDFVQTNLIGIINQDLQTTNDCDDQDADVVGDGVNNAECFSTVANSIGSVGQLNTASGTEVTDISQNNDITNMNQVLVAVNDCDQSGPGDNLGECRNDARNRIDPATQTNIATGDLFTDFFQDNDAAFSQTLDINNNCDETTFVASSENNEVDCVNVGQNFIGPVDQSNSATGQFDTLIEQDNNADVAQNLVSDNNCSGTGTFEGSCAFNDGGNTILDIEQTNTAGDLLDASSTQINNALVDQNMVLLNDCDEVDLGSNDAFCENFEPANFVGPITQTSFNQAGNEALGATIEQSNDVEITQNLEATNNCDEQGDSNNEADCRNFASNRVESISQSNNAPNVADDFVQNNLIGIINQDIQATNDCDDDDADIVDDGVNSAECGSDAFNSIGPVSQDNSAQGTEAADISQNNDIASMNQDIVSDNTCDQLGPGDNQADCGGGGENRINSLSQQNSAGGDLFSDISQDNDAAFSQSIDGSNDCDGTTFVATSENNEAECGNGADNFIDQVTQFNQGPASDDSSIDQGNNVDITQNLVADNNCDGTGTSTVDCFNTLARNNIDDITQGNTATGSDAAVILQSNNAIISQDMTLLNDCDETELGSNGASCINIEPTNIIGPILQDNQATGEDSSTTTQTNDIQVSQNLEGTNDCDESGVGSNLAVCQTSLTNTIGTITQQNIVGSLGGTDTETQSNLFSLNQNLVATNDCDETGSADNVANCSITASTTVGNILQTNTASSNILTINQDGTAKNDCDNVSAGTICSIDLKLILPSFIQSGDEELHINQVNNVLNTCSSGGNCAITVTNDFTPDDIVPNVQTLSLASASVDEEEGQEKQSQAQALTFSAASIPEDENEDATKSSATTTATTTTTDTDDGSNDNTQTSSSTEQTEKETETETETEDDTEKVDTSVDEETEDEETEDEETEDEETTDSDGGDEEEEEDEDGGDDDGGDDDGGDEEEDEEQPSS